MNKIKNIITILLCGIVIFGLSFMTWFKHDNKYSDSERRMLAQFPKLSLNTLKTGKFMNEFDIYSMDQFPCRDTFRGLKANVSKNIFMVKDNHGLYVIDDMVSKLEYPMNEAKVNVSINKINEVQSLYLNDTDCTVYLSVIPDKNYFMAPLGNYPMMDYESFIQLIKEKVSHDVYIDIIDLLSLDDYYHTDQHWRQECIVDVAKRIGNTMINNEYEMMDMTLKMLDVPFYGAYVGQSALSLKPDTIYYLTNDIINECVVTSYNTGSAKEASMYDMTKAYGKDAYEMFLSGSDPLIIIENSSAINDKELVVFRDSFGSSLIPLLCDQYSKITVVDLRYIKSNLLTEYIEFNDQDVLFIYSTLVLNNTISN